MQWNASNARCKAPWRSVHWLGCHLWYSLSIPAFPRCTICRHNNPSTDYYHATSCMHVRYTRVCYGISVSLSVCYTRALCRSKRLKMSSNCFSLFRPVTPTDVIKPVKTVPDKQCSLDPLPTWLLKTNVSVLCRLFCWSLQNRTVPWPSMMKSAKLIYNKKTTKFSYFTKTENDWKPKV